MDTDVYASLVQSLSEALDFEQSERAHSSVARIVTVSAPNSAEYDAIEENVTPSLAVAS